jgi:hypothetical protein
VRHEGAHRARSPAASTRRPQGTFLSAAGAASIGKEGGGKDVEGDLKEVDLLRQDVGR